MGESNEGIVMGIDPGPEQSGYVIWDSNRKRIISHRQEWNKQFRLSLLSEYKLAEIVCIEDVVFYGKVLNVSTFDTLKFIGRIQEILHDYLYYLIGFPELALFFCNARTGVKTPQINQVLQATYGGKGTKKVPGPFFGIREHEWSAAAVAIWCAEQGIADCRRKEQKIETWAAENSVLKEKPNKLTI